jgi:predicted dehydrogenase
MPLSIGLYGVNGHQIHGALARHPDARLAAVAAFPSGLCPEAPHLPSLDALLAVPGIDLVSLCSPRRADQAADAIRCLRAGRHVYAEKPCAMSEADLDAILAAARASGRQFHEMAGTVVMQPYRAAREAVRSGAVGEVVQVLTQKSYPWHERRPDDEGIDGGLALQVGVYPMRFFEHIAGMRIASVRLEETRLGNSRPGSACRRAVTFQARFENGGLGAAICNYLNPLGRRLWGYEMLRIFGTLGAVVCDLETGRARLLRPDEPDRDLDVSSPPTVDYFDLIVASLLGRGEMPLSIEEEVRPTRWALRARGTVDSEQWTVNSGQ